ncbi:MAG: immunity 22 family protein [Bacteroidia bacterium]|jgi:hypothetical protein|nr:immunity 22 family protein [Bacteroidia bacterium]
MKNKVSLWLGNFENADAFSKVMVEVFDEDGNSASPFMISFGIEYIDHDKIESVFDIQIQNRFFGNQECFSYSSTFSHKLIGLDFSKFNCAVCIFDFEYTGEIKKAQSLEFAGVFEYNLA